jgi:hypothetical protein
MCVVACWAFMCVVCVACGLDVPAVEPVVGPLPDFPPLYLQLQVMLVWSYILYLYDVRVGMLGLQFVSREVAGTGKAATQCLCAARALDVSAVEPVVGPLPEFPPPYLQLQVIRLELHMQHMS